MSAEAPPTSLPKQPTDPVPAQTGTTSSVGVVIGTLLKDVAVGFGITDPATFIGKALAPIVADMEDRIVDRVLKGLKSTTEISAPNKALDDDWERGT